MVWRVVTTHWGFNPHDISVIFLSLVAFERLIGPENDAPTGVNHQYDSCKGRKDIPREPGLT